MATVTGPDDSRVIGADVDRQHTGRSGGSGRLDLGSLPRHVWIRLFERDSIREKLRVSLVQHCNLSCFFCHNEGQGPIARRPQRPSLNAEEIATIVGSAVAEGVSKVKLTGGEPLLYRSGSDDILTVVRRLAQVRPSVGPFNLSMTTNGTLLSKYATRLAKAGLDRVTVSITTTRPSTFRALISPNDKLYHGTVAGLTAARAAGLSPIKINTAVYHSEADGLGNLEELRQLLDLAIAHRATELRLFTLIWYEGFSRFANFYHFFSPRMRSELVRLLSGLDVPEPQATVDILAELGVTSARRTYPKVEFGVDLGLIKLGFEAMKFGRLPAEDGSQEGPYAMRLAADGALRPTLSSTPSYDLIDGIRSHVDSQELRRRYRAALGEMP